MQRGTLVPAASSPMPPCAIRFSLDCRGIRARESGHMVPSRLDFRLEAVADGSRARAAVFRTLHNEVRTPLFMPVGTQATVKAQLPEALEESGSQILLANPPPTPRRAEADRGEGG